MKTNEVSPPKQFRVKRHPFAAPFSQKRLQAMSDAERNGPVPPRKLATSLPSGSAEQVSLVMDRVGHGVCLECGGSKETACGDFCGACLAGFPKTIDVGEDGEMLAFGGWRDVVVQSGPAIPGLGRFLAMRLGIFEYERKAWRPICSCDTLEEAKEAARKAYSRSLSASGGW